MGFDLYSLDRENATSEEEAYGSRYYFRANIWSWRPILAALDAACERYRFVPNMTDAEAKGMSYNDYYEISPERSLEFSLALTDLIDQIKPEGYRYLILCNQGHGPLIFCESPPPEEEDMYIATIDHLVKFASFCANGVGFVVG